MGELMRVLRSHPTGTRIIIFANTKRMCDQLSYSLMRDFRAAAIHGDKRQQERDQALHAFKDGRVPILVATDVAARGLDIPNVGAVVNYDFPNGIEDYVHRIGRTGRAGATGDSYTFLSPEVRKAHMVHLLGATHSIHVAVAAALAVHARQGNLTP